MSPFLQIEKLTKKYGNFTAVNGIDLNIAEGEFTALLGPNGAGKTTLIEMIEGVILPDAGSVHIGQKTWKNDSQYLKTIMGISFQETRFMDKVTVLETLKLFGAFYRLKNERIQEILKLVNLVEKQNNYTVNLSGGQRQRLAIGIAMLNNPKLLLLDEPTTGLDPHARREIWEIIEGLKQNGTTMILTTHYMEEAEYLCEKVVVMDQGKILAQGNVKDLISAHSSGSLIEATIHPPDKTDQLIQAVKEKCTQQKISVKNNLNQIFIVTSNTTSTTATLIENAKNQGIELNNLSIRNMNLEDLFMILAGRKLNE